MTAEEEAQETFHEAVRVYLGAVGYGDGLLVDWMLVSAQHVIPEGGGSATSIAITVSREQPVYRTAGLIQYASVKTNNRLVQNG